MISDFVSASHSNFLGVEPTPSCILNVQLVILTINRKATASGAEHQASLSTTLRIMAIRREFIREDPTRERIRHLNARDRIEDDIDEREDHFLEEDQVLSESESESESDSDSEESYVRSIRNSVKQLHVHLHRVRWESFQKLKEAFSCYDFITLLKAVMSSLQVSNGIDFTSLEELLWTDYENMCNMSQIESYQELDPAFREVAEKYFLLHKRKESGKILKLLVPEDLKICFDLIKQWRSAANISSQNNFLFGLPMIDDREHLRLNATSVLGELVAQCNFPNPYILLDADMRQQLVELCIDSHRQHDMDINVVRFLRHESRIHRLFYLPSCDVCWTLETGKWSGSVHDLEEFLKFILTALGKEKPRSQVHIANW